MKQIFVWPVNRILVDGLLPAWLERDNAGEVLSENNINRERFELLHYS